MQSLFSCPLCYKPLLKEPHMLHCPDGHCFDRSAAGYVHLLPANRKHSKNPGDDKAMVQARSAFLDKGYYAPLQQALSQLVLQVVANMEAPICLDSGCGEGYYTAGLYQSLTHHGHLPQVAGVDLSKFALRKAAKRLPQGEFGVASVYHLPMGEQSVDVLINVFSPLAVAEFARVLRPGGHFIYAVPAPQHLWQMKEILYAQPYQNPAKQDDYPGFVWRGVEQVRYPLQLDCGQDIMALFGMTPYAWKTPRDGVARLTQLDFLTCQAGFDLHIYEKQP